jgi:hypothetical protein
MLSSANASQRRTDQLHESLLLFCKHGAR